MSHPVTRICSEAGSLDGLRGWVCAVRLLVLEEHKGLTLEVVSDNSQRAESK